MKIKYFFAAFAFILLIGIFAPNIQAHLTKASFDRNKVVVTETKAVSPNEFLEMIHQQTKLDEKIRSSNKYSLAAKEVRSGLDKANDTYEFMLRHPKYKKVDIELKIAKTKFKGKTIHFISTCRIKKVYSNGKWKVYK